MAPILQVKNLQHVYSAGTPFEHIALDHVSFAVEKGEFVGVIGHTGSGKSTLMQHLNGLLKPTSGAVLLDGQDIWQDKKLTRQCHFRVGLVFQYPEYQLFEENVFADIAYGPKNMGLGEEEIAARVREAMAFTRLDESLAQKSPFELSGGQKRRVAIAGVLAMKPKVLVLDEPAAGLDPMGREEILGGLYDYQRKTGSTVVIVSHSMEDIGQYCDHLIVMNQGGVYCCGTPREVFAHAGELRKIGLDVPQITRLLQALRARGVEIPTDIYTVEAARAMLLSRLQKKEGTSC